MNCYYLFFFVFLIPVILSQFFLCTSLRHFHLQLTCASGGDGYGRYLCSVGINERP